MGIRRPTQAGTFYAGDAETLRTEIESCFIHRFGPRKLPKIEKDGPRKIVGLICPHAGYAYSGPVAANAYFELASDGYPDTVIVLGPNHTGYGSALALMDAGVWRTPLGDVEVDTLVAREILHETKLVDADELAHRHEHSIEVQLPFLQYLYGSSFKFVPICMLMQDLEVSLDIGKAIAEASSGRNILIIASTDMTHYEPQNRAESKDRQAIEAMLKLDEAQLQSVVESQNITMCGYGPASVAIVASKILGATKAQLLCYKTSGDVTNDRSQVVGYASLKITK